MSKAKSRRRVSCCHLSSCRCSESGGFNGAQRKIALARAVTIFEPAHVSEGKKRSLVLPGGCSSAPSAIEYGALPHAQVLHDLALQALNEDCKAHVHQIQRGMNQRVLRTHADFSQKGNSGSYLLRARAISFPGRAHTLRQAAACSACQHQRRSRQSVYSAISGPQLAGQHAAPHGIRLEGSRRPCQVGLCLLAHCIAHAEGERVSSRCLMTAVVDTKSCIEIPSPIAQHV